MSGTHYQLLGVPPDATAGVIQNAFFGLAKKWHPDRLRPEVSDLKDQATRVFSRISEASQVLSDPATRKAYDESLLSGDTADEAEQVQQRSHLIYLVVLTVVTLAALTLVLVPGDQTEDGLRTLIGAIFN